MKKSRDHVKGIAKAREAAVKHPSGDDDAHKYGTRGDQMTTSTTSSRSNSSNIAEKRVRSRDLLSTSTGIHGNHNDGGDDDDVPVAAKRMKREQGLVVITDRVGRGDRENKQGSEAAGIKATKSTAPPTSTADASISGATKAMKPHRTRGGNPLLATKNKKKSEAFPESSALGTQQPRNEEEESHADDHSEEEVENEDHIMNTNHHTNAHWDRSSTNPNRSSNSSGSNSGGSNSGSGSNSGDRNEKKRVDTGDGEEGIASLAMSTSSPSSGASTTPSSKSALPSTSNSGPAASTNKKASRGAADALYRLMHALPRSDQLRIQRCRLDYALCERAATYFKEDFTAHPVRQLTLQLGCRSDAPWDPEVARRSGGKPTHDGFQLLFPLIFHHAFHLKELDLSRNDLCAADIATLCKGLRLNMPTAITTNATATVTASRTPPLRLLNLSYNSRIGNEGVLMLFRAIEPNARVKAVILRCVGVDDKGAVPLAQLLRRRPFPTAAVGDEYSRDAEKHADNFLVNLNENRIGAVGTAALGKGLPSYISVTLCKQRVQPDRG